MVKGDLYTVDEISDSYLDVDTVEMVAIFGTHGYLELALNKAKLASLCGIEPSSTSKVIFYDGDKDYNSGSLF
jgi:S-adenosylmethionine hydrolase